MRLRVLWDAGVPGPRLASCGCGSRTGGAHSSGGSGGGAGPLFKRSLPQKALIESFSFSACLPRAAPPGVRVEAAWHSLTGIGRGQFLRVRAYVFAGITEPPKITRARSSPVQNALFGFTMQAPQQETPRNL